MLICLVLSSLSCLLILLLFVLSSLPLSSSFVASSFCLFCILFFFPLLFHVFLFCVCLICLLFLILSSCFLLAYLAFYIYIVSTYPPSSFFLLACLLIITFCLVIFFLVFFFFVVLLLLLASSMPWITSGNGPPVEWRAPPTNHTTTKPCDPRAWIVCGFGCVISLVHPPKSPSGPSAQPLQKANQLSPKKKYKNT